MRQRLHAPIASDRPGTVDPPKPWSPLQRIIAGATVAMAVLFILVSLLHLIEGYSIHFESRTELALEKPTVTTIALIRAGQNIYDQKLYNDIPFNLVMYPPAYHYLASLLPQSASDPYRTPRLLSATFMVLSAFALMWWARTAGAIALSAVLAIFFLSVIPVCRNTVFARQDPMALFFSVASILSVASAIGKGGKEKARLIGLGALLAFVAVATKQSYVAAPVATLAWLVRWDRRSLRNYLAWIIGLAAVGAIVAQLSWGNGFWWSILRVPSTGFSPSNYLILFQAINRQWTYRIFIVVALAFTLRRTARVSDAEPAKSDLLRFYWFASLATTLAFLCKEGASTNYFFEPTLAGLLLIQNRLMNLRPTTPTAAFGGKRWVLAILMLGLTLCAFRDTLTLSTTAYAFSDREGNAEGAAYLRLLEDDLSKVESSSPGLRANHILVSPALRNEVLSLGKIPLFSDIYLYRVLWRDGRLDSRPALNESLRTGKIDVVILPQGFPVPDPEGAFFGLSFYQTLATRYVRVRSVIEGDYYVPRQDIRR